MKQFDFAIVAFNQQGAVFDPIARVVVREFAISRCRRRVDMAANHSVAVRIAGSIGQALFKLTYKPHCLFDALLDP